MFRRSLLTGLTLVLPLLASPAAQAIDAIPQSCLVCRHASGDASFVRCLYRCLEHGDGHIGLKPIEGPDIALTDWTLKENTNASGTQAVRTATLEAEDSFDVFFDRVNPKLVLTREKDGTRRAFIDLNPVSLSVFEQKITVQFDNRPAMPISTTLVWNKHALRIDDRHFFTGLKHAQTVRVYLSVPGTSNQVLEFESDEFLDVLRWLNQAP